MESKDFFGAPDPEEQLAAPSVLSVVVDQCVSDFSGNYRAKQDGTFELYSQGVLDDILTENDMANDICAWVRELEGGNPVGNKIVSLVRSNPGWGQIVARRVIRELRKWAS